MSHVDDGTLHALLDGALHAEDPELAAGVEAHLGRCADCRARLNAAAAVRDRAGQVLDLLDADPRPDFQEVLARAGHDRQGALARQARRTRGAAWAATILLALGTGYLVRDRLVPDPPAAESAERAMDTAIAEGPADLPPPPTVERGATVERETATRSDARSDARAEAPATARARSADPPPPAAAPAQPDRQALATEPDPTPAAARALESMRPVDALRPGTTRAAGVAGGAPGVVAPLGDPPVEEEPAWRPIALDEALTLMDGILYRLPNAEIMAIEASGTGAHPRVRTRQRLPGELEVVVTQERADVADPDRAAGTGAVPAPAAAAYAPTSEDVVRVLRSRYWLTLQSSLPPHAIQTLAAAAAPVPVP
jgi:hypothetical protein